MTLEISQGTELLTIETTLAQGALVITLSGELDIAGAPVLLDALMRSVQSEVAEVLCDLGSVTYIDSSGISVLLTARKRLHSLGRELVLVAPSGRVTKVLEIAGISSLFVTR